MPRIPVLVAEVNDSLYAKKAGLAVKDKIIDIDGNEVKYFDQIKPLLAGKENDTVKLTVLRNEKPVELTTVLSSTATIGFIPMLPGLDDLKAMKVYSFETKEYGFFCFFSGRCKQSN